MKSLVRIQNDCPSFPRSFSQMLLQPSRLIPVRENLPWLHARTDRFQRILAHMTIDSLFLLFLEIRNIYVVGRFENQCLFSNTDFKKVKIKFCICSVPGLNSH